MQFAHAVQLFKTDDEEHLLAQSLVVESLRQAQGYARERGVDVDLIAVRRIADLCECPPGFRDVSLLDRSIRDFGSFQVPALPILSDVCDRLVSESQAEWLVYSNADIIVMPFFYPAVASLIERGARAISILRRTVPEGLARDAADLPRLFAEIGEPHAGFDCFVFHRDDYPRFIWRPVCLGAVFVGRALLLNMIAAAGAVTIPKNLHLTLHVGNSRRGGTVK